MPEGGAASPSLIWLDRPLSTGRGEPAADSRYGAMLRLSNQGEYEQATRVADSLLADGLGDAQVLSRYLFGVFLARGFSVLPRILDAMGRVCEAAFEGSDKKARGDAEL